MQESSGEYLVEDDPYCALKLDIKDECEAACLDCNCEAAFFKDSRGVQKTKASIKIW